MADVKRGPSAIVAGPLACLPPFLLPPRPFPPLRFGRVDEARRRLQLALYVESLLEAELEAKQKALVLLKALIRLVEVWGWWYGSQAEGAGAA